MKRPLKPHSVIPAQAGIHFPAVIQHQPKSIDKVMEVSGLMRWQAELMMPAINGLGL